MSERLPAKQYYISYQQGSAHGFARRQTWADIEHALHGLMQRGPFLVFITQEDKNENG